MDRTKYDYDSNGNLLTQTGPLGTVTWTYDGLDRPLTRTSSGGSGNVTWEYDAGSNGLGLLSRRIDDASRYTPKMYDRLGRVRNETYNAGSRLHDFTTTYDRLGQVASRTYPGSRTVNWIRDDAGFLSAILNGSGQPYATAIQWDAQGRLLSWTDGDWLTSTNTFDDATGRLHEVLIGTEEHFEYFFDPGDRVREIRDRYDEDRDRSFLYDSLNRLRFASGPFRSGPSNPLLYDYDALGNLKCLGASNLSNCQADGTELTYPAPDPDADRPHAPTHINGQAVTHNGAGNLEAWGSRSYEYDDALGVLRTVKENDVPQATMSYDASGRMGVLTEVVSGETRYFVAEDFEWLKTSGLGRIQIRLAGTVIASDEATYPPPGGPVICASLPAMEGDWRGLLGLFAPGLCAYVLLQVGFALRRRPRGARLRPALAGGTAGVFLVATSVPLPGLVPEARAAVTPTGVTYYHSDHLGSSVVITNGEDVQKVLYRPFGQAAPGPDAVPEFGFTGQRWVDSIGIYDYGARWYEPKLGRFLSPDSVVPAAYDPQSVNPYSYVRNNPLNRIDPTGNFDWGGLWGGFTGLFSNIFAPIGNAFTWAGGSFDSFMDSVGNGQIDSLSFGFGGGGLPQVQVQFGPGAQAATSSAPSQGVETTSQPIPERAVNQLTPFFPGFDLESVRVRTPLPGECAGANACITSTTGNIIFVDRSKKNFDTASGVALIGHEIQHFVQRDRLGSDEYFRRYEAELREVTKTYSDPMIGRRYISFEVGAAVTQRRIFDALRDQGLAP